MNNPRVVLAGVLLASAVVVVVMVLAAGGSGGEGDKPDGPVRAKLTLEQFRSPETGVAELLVNLPEARLNTLDTTGGKTSVLLRCVDERGAQMVRQPTKWPLLEEAGYPYPHIHQPATPGVLENVRACSLTGPEVNFEGRVPGPPPIATQ